MTSVLDHYHDIIVCVLLTQYRCCEWRVASLEISWFSCAELCAFIFMLNLVSDSSKNLTWRLFGGRNVQFPVRAGDLCVRPRLLWVFMCVHVWSPYIWTTLIHWLLLPFQSGSYNLNLGPMRTFKGKSTSHHSNLVQGHENPYYLAEGGDNWGTSGQRGDEIHAGMRNMGAKGLIWHAVVYRTD